MGIENQILEILTVYPQVTVISMVVSMFFIYLNNKFVIKKSLHDKTTEARVREIIENENKFISEKFEVVNLKLDKLLTEHDKIRNALLFKNIIKPHIADK